MGRHRSGPTTAPIDLAALAAGTDAPTTRISVRGPANRVPRTRFAPAGSLSADALPTDAPPRSTPTTGAPAAGPVPSGSHRAPAARLPLLASTRTAGVLALAGALAGAGLATTATSAAVVAAPPPATGDLQVSELANASRAATPTARDTDTGSGRSTAPATGSTRAAAAPRAADAAPAAAPAAALQDGGKTLWSADFASAGLDHFKSTPWNVVGAKTPKVSDGALAVAMPGGGKRAEVEPDFKNLREGDEYWFGFSVKLADDFPVDGDQWQVITQWKNEGTGTPPLEVKVQDGHFLLDGDGGSFSELIGDAKPGQWTHLALRVHFSSSDGSVSAWQDGASTLSDYAPASGTLYSGKSSYLKVGLYRDSSISSDGALQFGSYAIGTSRGAVSKDVTRGR